MSPEDSIAEWYDRLQAGDEAAARELWVRYFPRLVGLARAKLAGLDRKAAADEEDVALSAFDSFCQRAKRDAFADVRARDSLWRVLMTITARKADRLIRDQRRLKRGGGKVTGESALDTSGVAGGGLDRVAGPAPSPEVEAELSEAFLRLLDKLGDADLRRIALWKLDGHTNEEIATKLDRSVPTVERKLARIREMWSLDFGGSE